MLAGAAVSACSGRQSCAARRIAAAAPFCACALQVWVLTGDKVETAISIAFSCRLFSEGMAIVELRDRDFERALAAAGVQRSAASNVSAAPDAGTMEQIVEVEGQVRGCGGSG